MYNIERQEKKKKDPKLIRQLFKKGLKENIKKIQTTTTRKISSIRLWGGGARGGWWPAPLSFWMLGRRRWQAAGGAWSWAPSGERAPRPPPPPPPPAALLWCKRPRCAGRRWRAPAGSRRPAAPGNRWRSRAGPAERWSSDPLRSRRILQWGSFTV